jgi:hypothetical protein
MNLDKQMWGLSLRDEQSKKMEQTFFDNETDEEARTRSFFVIFLKVLWTSLMIVVLLGGLLSLTFFLDWWRFSLSCILGLLSGFSIAVGLLASPQNKALITLVLGVLMLPGFAVFLSLMAVRNVQAFETSSTILTSFVVYALVVCVGVLVLVKIWQKKPVMIQKETEEKETPGR